ELSPSRDQPVLYGPDFTHVVVIGKVVEGVVKDAATGKPIAGASVMARLGYGTGTAAVTDKEGKYRLEGLPQEKTYRVHVNAPQGSTYLRRAGSAEGTPGATPVRLDVELYKGVVVTGQVIDKQTRKGVQAG